MTRTYQRLNVFTDGASRNNPGNAAIGVVIKDEKGNTIKTLSRYIGTATNNVAEYTALVEALEILLDYSTPETIIHLDSQLVVQQVLGKYKTRQPHLLPLVRLAREKIAKLTNVTLSHIPREKNKEADALANAAIDKALKKE